MWTFILTSPWPFVSAAETATSSYYKSFPIMDFSHYQHVGPPAFQPIQPKEKSYIHQPLPAHHDIHAPLSISIPPSHLEHARLPKTTTHPFISSSAFKAWEPADRHVHRQISAPIHSSSSVHSSNRRHGYSTRRQQSIENMPDVFNQHYRGMYGRAGGGAGQGQHVQGQHTSQPSYYQHSRQKSYSTHSATEVTVWVCPRERPATMSNRNSTGLGQMPDFEAVCPTCKGSNEGRLFQIFKIIGAFT